jgi:hypothetical protein
MQSEPGIRPAAVEQSCSSLGRRESILDKFAHSGIWKAVPGSLLLPLFLLAAFPVQAHHGVGTIGAAGLEGPGAPVETSISTTLPYRHFFAYTKLDYAQFELLTPERDDEGRFNAFWMFGLGYGFTSWLSGYIFIPFSSKVLEDNSFNTTGFTDISLFAQLGFKWDQGLRWIPKTESLDDLEDWHFTVYGAATLPTGDANIADSNGNIDPGMSLGFGKPSYLAGTNGTKMLTSHSTLIVDLSGIWFLEYTYDDGNSAQFGTEYRVNLAWAQRLLTNLEKRLRFDGILEANYLSLGRDRGNGEEELGTGGQILYLQPGVRFYAKNFTAALGIKFPAWTELNEEDLQQGAEGTEDYRIQVTFSTLF